MKKQLILEIEVLNEDETKCAPECDHYDDGGDGWGDPPICSLFRFYIEKEFAGHRCPECFEKAGDKTHNTEEK